MNSFWIVLLSCVLAVYASPACDQETLMKTCKVRVGDGKTFPFTASDLKQECSASTESISCISDFVERCPGVLSKGYHDFYIAANKLVGRICDGDLTEKYLRNAKCFNEVFTDTEKQQLCAKKVDIEKDFNTNVIEVQACLSSFVEDICGNEAFEVLLEVYKVTKLLTNA